MDIIDNIKMIAEHGAQTHVIAGYKAREEKMLAAFEELRAVLSRSLDDALISGNEDQIMRFSGALATIKETVRPFD